MKTRRRTRSQKDKSQSSSNNPEIKRRKCKTIQSKMVMTNADWLEWDADLLTRLGDIRERVNAADIFQHDVMDNEEYGHLMKRCFRPTIDAVPRVPRALTANQNVGSRLSSRGAGSGAGSGASVSNEQMHLNAPTAMDQVLAELHTKNTERFDGQKLLLFTRMLKRDPQVSNVFLLLQTHEQMLAFIDGLQLGLFNN